MPDISEQLQEINIISSAPSRVDVGGTWDLKCFALPYVHAHPVTTNLALTMRTRIHIRSYKPGWVRILDDQHHEEFLLEQIDMSSHFGLLFAIVAYFGLSGMEIEIGYGCPPRSGVGGSGTLSVALAGALARAQELAGGGNLSREAIVELVYNIEDGMRFSFTGLQDQCAAAFGGISRWHWTYGELHGKFRREQLLENTDEVSERLLVAYVGKSHDSNDVNSKQVTDFLAGKNRAKWFRINDIANAFALALQRSEWVTAGQLINEETEIRCSIVPSRITNIGEKLQAVCREMQIGFATAGSGNGGCVWALTQTPDQIAPLTSSWQDILNKVPSAQILPVDVDPVGLKVEQIAL
jgi:D-glycero-alpha-D-manno-heptose-7-phosphate kinase